MGFPGQGADSPIMSDAFMAFRLMMNYLEDLSMATDPTSGKLRVDASPGIAITSGVLTTVTTVTTLTNQTNMGGNPANSLVLDIMDNVWYVAIRPQIV